jgi:hypothetical protein
MPVSSLSFRFCHQSFVYIYILSQACYMSRPYYTPWFNHFIIRRTAKIMTFITAIFFSLLLLQGARGSVVGWGTVLQGGRSRVQFPMSLHLMSQTKFHTYTKNRQNHIFLHFFKFFDSRRQEKVYKLNGIRIPFNLPLLLTHECETDLFICTQDPRIFNRTLYQCKFNIQFFKFSQYKYFQPVQKLLRHGRVQRKLI